jgi:hypothetical protein
MVGVPNPVKVEAQTAAPEDTADPLCGTDPTLVGCWLFNEGSGTTAFDGSIHTNDGTVVGDSIPYPMWVAGRGGLGYALHFAGGVSPIPAQYVKVQANSSLDITGDITIAAWMKPEQIKTQDVIKKAINSSIDGYELALSSGTGNCLSPNSAPPCAFARFNQYSNPSTPEKYRVDTTTKYSDIDPWTFYAVTSTTVAGITTLRLYKNGTLSNTVVPSSPLTIATNSLYLGFGAELNASGNNTTGRMYHGLLDDVRIFNRALTDQDIADLYGLPTAVNLNTFNATSRLHFIQLDWHSAQETDLIGFNLFRAEAVDGAQVKINPQLIPAINPGQLQGNAYQYLDTIVVTGKLYYYWVEWVGNNSSELYGPVAARLLPFWSWLPFGFK